MLRDCAGVVALRQIDQRFAERRQILFPGKHAGAQRKLRIGAADGVFEKGAHARHDFQIADDRAADALAHGFGFSKQRFHDLEKLWPEIGVVHGQQKLLMAALAHQVSDALVHGDTS